MLYGALADAIRCWQIILFCAQRQTPAQASAEGLRNLLRQGLTQSQVWCEVVALACDLLA